jgi:sterol desaturase/sphingolipid hydroxylase (fatty acid hydroxylase superfamily)
MGKDMIGTYHYVALALFAGFVLLELLLSGRMFPKVAAWRIKGAAFTLLYFSVGTFAPLLWDSWLGEHRILAADTLPIWAQVFGGFLILELGVYCWHRTMHNVQPLWRWFHQMHHSAERVDIWGAFYFHPFDMLGWTLLGSLALVLGFGVSAEAAIIINLLATFCSMFQHANIRTPHWLGYLITRPESHSAHHERGVHARNYGDVPWFDMLLGTFHNPKTFDGEVGFYEGGSKRIGDMLIGRQIA